MTMNTVALNPQNQGHWTELCCGPVSTAPEGAGLHLGHITHQGLTCLSRTMSSFIGPSMPEMITRVLHESPPTLLRRPR